MIAPTLLKLHRPMLLKLIFLFVLAISIYAAFGKPELTNAQGLVCYEKEVTVQLNYGDPLPAPTTKAQCEVDGTSVQTLSSCTATCTSNASGTPVCQCPAGCNKSGLVVGGQTCGGTATPGALNCADLSCTTNQYCAFTGGTNGYYTCAEKKSSGATCADYKECASGVCQGGLCVGGGQLPEGTVCYNQDSCETITVSKGTTCPATHPVSNPPDKCAYGVPWKTICYNSSCSTTTVDQGTQCPSTHPTTSRPESCATGGSPIISCSGYVNQAQCNQSADNLDCAWNHLNNTCGTRVTSCSGYTNQAQCNQSADSLNCTWDHQNNRCGTAGTNCTPGTCINGKRCEYDPVSGGGYLGTHNCTVGNCTNGGVTCSSSEYCDASTTSCKNKLSYGTACSTNAQCATGQCVGGKCIGTETNISCTSDATCPSGFLCRSGKCSQATGTPPDDGGNGGTGTPPAEQCTAQALARCGSNGQCCANGGVCQGVAGQEVCQIPEESPAQQCADGGGTCSGWIGFKCTSLTSTGECLSNPLWTANRSDAEAHAGSCGQVDKVCVGGTNNGKLCGDFTIYNQCSGTTTPPGETPPPGGEEPTYFCNSTCQTDAQCQTADSRFRCALTGDGNKRCRLNTNSESTSCQPPTGPMCMSISMSKADGTNNTENTWKPGDAVRFTCGTVPGVNHYIFRLIKPDDTIITLNATGAMSEVYTLEEAGRFRAQCQICTGPSDDTCHAFEDPNSESAR